MTMRVVRRVGLLTALMIMALVPAALAVSPAGPAAPDVALAVTQPIASMPVVTTHGTSALLNSGVIALVGSALLGIASLVRRTTRN